MTKPVMLADHLPQLQSQRVVLASGSPRRKEILEQLGLKIEVIPSTFPEDLDKVVGAVSLTARRIH